MNDGLTDEERAALELDDNGDEKSAAGSGAGGDAGDSNGAGAGTGAGDEGAGAGAGDAGGADAGNGNGAGSGAADGAGAAGDGNGAGDGAGAGEGAGAGAAADGQPRPVFVAEAPENAEARLTEIGQKKAELRKQYDDGDITFDEYDSAKDSLSSEERRLEREIDKANMAASMQQQQAKNEWESTVGSFLDANDIYKSNPVLYRALDAEVKRVASTEEAKNYSFKKILEEAHKSVSGAFGIKKADTPPVNDPKKGERKQPELPPTLRNVPAAESADTSGNRFAALDRLLETDPMAHEEALARMSKAERDAYMAAA
ncbi:hypothetical protein [Paraburkholderia terrae]|uniref:hypothetical protein n=1 Tax=Paraburkholderia terrae TaxID=311230 RepID=UPI001EE345DC|nr:hypothetical protein [Paraburkholderia terrae]GJH00224.1 hypothetical protein CBA19C8_06725 [Paraburkholderia terrae]